MDDQKIIITLNKKGDINITMDPPLMGEMSEEYSQASDSDKILQKNAANVVALIIESLKSI